MDVRTSSAPPDPDRPPIDHVELRAILSNLSHELGRQLVSLRAGFDLLLGDDTWASSPEQRGHLQTMAASCDNLLHLTRSYLDYAGLVRGARPVQYGSFTIAALIGEIDRQFAPVAAARRIAWSCGREGADALVTTDAARCQQIFGNLAANALKYTPEGGQVRVVGRHEGEDWSVTVTDTGPGIPADARTKVFEPFYRLPRDERSGSEGHGLGLAICRELVDQMGGTIEIGPAVEPGTLVTVRLPVEPPAHGPGRVAPSRAKSSATRLRSGTDRAGPSGRPSDRRGHDAEADGGPLAGLAADRERPAVTSPDAVGDAQADAQVRRLGAEEGLDGLPHAPRPPSLVPSREPPGRPSPAHRSRWRWRSSPRSPGIAS